MKKLFACFLICLTLLTSCSGPVQVQIGFATPAAATATATSRPRHTRTPSANTTRKNSSKTTLSMPPSGGNTSTAGNAITPTPFDANGFPAPTANGYPAPAASNTPSGPAAPPQNFAGKVPNFDHIILIVLENHDYESVINNPKMPNFNSLAKQNVLLTEYFAVRHPSLPNYISLTGGDNFGITKDCTSCYIDQPNLADRIETSGRTWRDYQEDMPSPCFLGNSGDYMQKHNPFIYFNNIRNNSARCQNSVVPLTQLDADLAAKQLPNFAFIMPNLCHSGHDCSLDQADQWMGAMVSKLQSSQALGEKSLIIVTFDEGSESSVDSCCGMGNGAGGRVATLLISPLAKPGFTDGTPISHFGLLKTILVAWGLPDLGKTAMPETLPITQPWK